MAHTRDIDRKRPALQLTDGCPEKPRLQVTVDLSNLKSYVSTPEELHEFIGIYLNQTALAISKLEEVSIGDNNPEWASITHYLKGSASMAGATTLHNLFKEAQEMVSAPEAEKRRVLSDIYKAFFYTRIFLLKEAHTSGKSKDLNQQQLL